MQFSSPPPDGGPSESGAGGESQTQSTTTLSYIKEMETSKDWQNALENRVRPVLIQAGASWCGPCQMIKPMLIEAVQEREGKIEYLYVDIDKHQKIAELLRVSHVTMLWLLLILLFCLGVDLKRASCVPCQKR